VKKIFLFWLLVHSCIGSIATAGVNNQIYYRDISKLDMIGSPCDSKPPNRSMSPSKYVYIHGMKLANNKKGSPKPNLNCVVKFYSDEMLNKNSIVGDSVASYVQLLKFSHMGIGCEDVKNLNFKKNLDFIINLSRSDGFGYKNSGFYSGEMAEAQAIIEKLCNNSEHYDYYIQYAKLFEYQDSVE